MELTDELLTLLSIAAFMGFLHTLAGPDHYLPFVMISRARGWSATKTAAVTAMCGVGHVLGSVLLGVVGIAAGLALAGLEDIESTRSNYAAWLMIAFGLVYAVWSLKRRLRGRPHTHKHPHADGSTHMHTHTHEGDHVHVHESEKRVGTLTPWVLFTIFVFGPCEVLIPLLMYPAANESTMGVVLVTCVFGVTTIATMLCATLALHYGFKLVKLEWLERNTHTLAGLTIALCGGLILIGL